ncbi:MAG: radical SAM protein [Myxococcota bacterium]
MREPGVLLISPGIIKWTDMDFGLPHMVSMAGWLEREVGVRVEILDLNYEGGDHAHLARRIEALGPHLVIGLSCFSSFDYRRVMALAGFLKQLYPDTPLVTGGYHASALPDDLVFDGSPFDSVVMGEGELPMQRIVETLLGGGEIDRIYPSELIQDLDALPMYAWDKLDRYWPRATDIGRKFQIFLSRGCPYHCTFCMERSKSGYQWRAYTPERAVAELERLSTYTDLGQWVINVADPLFGFKRRWRREVLEGIVAKGLLPRSYWTLTRSDDLDREDVQLLSRARFAIGIGLESGSPTMLEKMQKGNTTQKYLDAVRRLSRLANEEGLTWASNLIIGHPGETPETMQETADFVREIFLSGPQTRGWLSVDPFRLYPGSYVHEVIDLYEKRDKARFFHKEWWKSWYSASFRAEHLDPSDTVDFEHRVRFMHATYAPILDGIRDRFVGQGREVDAVWSVSIEGQRAMLTDASRDRTLELGRSVQPDRGASTHLSVPVGLQVRDPRVRQREEAVRRLLDHGVLRTEDLVEALLQVPPERFMSEATASAMLQEAPPLPPEGALPEALAFHTLAMGLEALEPAMGSTVADLTARTGYVAALLEHLVGPEGRVVAVRAPGRELLIDGSFDRLWIGAALPRFPKRLVHVLTEGGRAVTALGPRFRPQDLVVLTRHGDDVSERIVARVRVPVYGGWGGWLTTPPVLGPERSEVRFERWEGPALAAHVLAHLDLGADAASHHDPTLPQRPWAAPLLDAYRAAPGHLALQVVGLHHETVKGLVDALRFDPPPGLTDPAGRVLAQRFAEAIEAERDAFFAAWVPTVPALADGLAATLAALRQALWKPQGREAPPLRVLDVPALGPNGRATQVGPERRVATSLTEAPEHVLLQVLHEEMHPITDPIVLAERKERDRSTRVGSPGFGLHAELETVAVQATEAFLAARSPQLIPAFERWCARLA